MKYSSITLLLILLLQISNAQNYLQDRSGNYLGERTPKDTAIIFAPEIISVTDRYEYGLAISPKHDEILFTAEAPGDSSQLEGLIKIKRVGDKWLEPKKANLNRKGYWEQEAFFSPDGNNLYYAVAYNDSVKLWKSVKNKQGWSEGTELESPINKSTKILFYATISGNGNLYYTDVIKRKVLMSPLEDNSYKKIVDPGISKGGHAFISPDESFILLDALGDDSYGKRDIYISFKNKDNTWTKPVNLGPTVNTDFNETCPSLSPDGKFIFFGRYNDLNNKSNIYWISSEIIEKLKP